VAISTDGGSTYTINAGNVVYAEDAKLSNCDTTSMQTFGAAAAACKAAIQQGQVIVLLDSRDDQKYRVKKMPDGNIWMIDNWKYNNGNYYDPSSTTYCSSAGLVWTHNPGTTTGCGYLYAWSSTINISPDNWIVFPLGYDIYKAMHTAATNSDGSRNPVYSTTYYMNFGEGDTGNPAPWLGVYSGGRSYNTSQFSSQGINGTYWGSRESVGSEAYYLGFSKSSVSSVYDTAKYDDYAIRSIL
jgi:uncharacterized protein (TIGR02145 family)